MQAPGARAACLREWQKNSLAAAADSCPAAQKAEACRAQLLRIQCAWASSELSQACAGRLFRKHAERYAAIVDSDSVGTGLNNYAESVFASVPPQQTDSDEWRSGLSLSNVFQLRRVREMMRAGEELRGSLLGAADASAVVCGGAAAPDPPKLSVCGGSGESNPLAEPAHGAGWAQGAPESGPAGPLNAQPPAAPSAPKPCSVAPAPFGDLATPLFGNVQKESSSAPKASPGLSLFLSHQPRPPAGSDGPWDRSAFYGAGPTDTLSAPPPSRALRKTEGNGPGPREEGGPPSFKTAKEQLWAEQQKKLHPPARAPAAPCGSVKKSLGASRSRGIFGKFVPPVPKPDGDANGGVRHKPDSAGPPEPAPLLDARLKGVEPRMAELIMNEIVDHGPPVDWDDIAGVEFAKAAVKEIVVWPMLRPDIFTGLRGPPRGILLFGPPGTGKTLIGKCIASQSGATFFSISASSLTSKWVGEGEKMVRALFAVARCQQPAVIFIDEIDSLLSQRADGEHESSRRIKTEFLVQLDGATTSPEDRILVVGATNRPQEIDEAARRRLVKRLYIPLPEAAARKQMVTRLMARERCRLRPEEVELVVQRTEGFSGADMTQLCREASLGPIRGLQAADIATITADQVPPIAYRDFENALRAVRPSVSPADLELYENWNKTFGCGK